MVLILPVVVLSTIIISVLPYWTIAYVKQTLWKNGVLYGVDQWKDDIRIFGCDANGKNAWIDTIYLDNEYDMSFYNVETVNLINDNTFGLLLKNVNITDVNRFVYITYDLEKRHVINTEDVNIKQNASQNEFNIKDNHISDAIKQREKGKLGSYASLIEGAFVWDDLIIDASVKQQMRYICNQIKYRNIVGEEWGFFEKTSYGRGVSALFYGSPGTGKTMAVQIIAKELCTGQAFLLHFVRKNI